MKPEDLGLHRRCPLCLVTSGYTNVRRTKKLLLCDEGHSYVAAFESEEDMQNFLLDLQHLQARQKGSPPPPVHLPSGDVLYGYSVNQREHAALETA